MKQALVLSGGGGRGAFQAGVWKYLTETGFCPDIICGTSVGTINGAAILSGMSPGELIEVWKDFGPKVYQFRFPKFFNSLLRGKDFKSLMNNSMLRKLLETYLDVDAIRKNPVRLVISAIDMKNSVVEYCDNDRITMDYILASSAMPLVFPWITIGGRPYWDGGLMANTPILPALESGATEIVVVLLSPIGAFPVDPPKSPIAALELVFEQFLYGSCRMAIDHMKQVTEKDVHIRLIAPERMLGLRSVLDFSKKSVKRLIDEGYRCAEKQFQPLQF